MSPQLQNILDLIKQSAQLNDADKAAIEKTIKETDKALEIANFKLDRTEKVKRTTAILLEETIAELEQKRKAVEAQNRELEIESSLERVRTVAMGMKKPDDLLSICEVLFKELQALGFSELRNALIHTYVDEKNYFVDYDFSDFTGGRISRIPYNSLPFIEKYLKEIRKSKDAFTEIELGGKELEEWKDFRRTSGQTDDPRLDSALSLYYYNYSIGVGDVGISTFHPIVHEKREILKRFRNVFDLAYRRYIDIQQAEAQAREAQIEAALEKVRSRSLAMHHSDELEQVVVSLFNRLTELGLSFDGALIFIFEKEKRNIQLWIATNHLAAPVKIDLPYDEEIKNNAIIKDLWNAIENGKHIFNKSYSGETKNEYFRYVGKYNESKIPEAVRQLQIEKESWTACFAAEKNSVVGFDSWSGHIIKEEDFQISIRFAKVFEQAYTRFLDLQKAEAQAREAKIEAALERTRTQSMLMQQSHELNNTVSVFHEQLQLLGIDSEFSYLWLPDEDKSTHLFLATWGEAENNHIVFKNKEVTYPLDKTEPSIAACYVAWESGDPIHVNTVRPSEIENYFGTWSELLGGIEKFKPKYFKDGLYYVDAYMKYGCFGIVIRRTIVQEEEKILARFTREFERTYTRFLDLQKAEAQAREARIEAALERVRSKTMAMHNSVDVSETVITLFDEVVKLGIESVRCGIGILNETKQMELWTAQKNKNGKSEMISGYLDMTIHPLLENVYDAWKKKETSFSYELTGDDLVRYFKAINNSRDYPLRYDLAKLPPVQFHNSFFFSDGAFYSFTAEPLSAEASRIFKRFVAVFGQTYRRFLDLLKAEAQAREAQIEAALEKVRSRSLAMHKSDELQEVVHTVFEKLKELNVDFYTVIIVIFQEGSKDIIWWMENKVNQQYPKILVRYADNPYLIDLFDAKENGRELLSKCYSGEAKSKFYNYLLQDTDLKHVAANQKKFLLENEFAGISVAISKNTGIHITSYSKQSFSEEENEILKRFAKVFEQAYIRFMDLQKAEAQAREALIEAALERVRARTMAMHSSEDVSIAAATMFIELEKLGIENFRGGILNIKENKTMDVWSVNKSADSDPHDPVGRGKTIRAAGQWDMTLHPWWRKLYDGWVNKDEFLQYFLTGTEREDYVKILDARRDYIPGGVRELPDCNIQAYYFGEGAVWTFSLQPHSDEDKQVMKKFASVFSLTFRRYQDLKKAEAQAREATIEAALERVRARAMSMQTSEDVVSATSVLFSELEKLGIKTMRCGILIIDKTQTMEVWTSVFTTDGQITRVIGRLDMRIHPLLEGIFKSWKQKEDVFRYKLIGDDIQRYYSALANAHKPYAVLLQNSDVPDHYCHVYLFEEGGLYTFSVDEHTNEERQILKRFTSVFSLTFRRYQDLKKAEAQAKEAIKQATLDRIRADIASMRTVADLDKITPLIWNELNILGIQFIRCGVFIMDETQRLIHTFLSAPDGKAIAAFHLPYDTSGNLSKVLIHWEKNEKYLDHWDQSAFTELANILVKQGAIVSPEQYLASIPEGGFYLHFLPFMQGMLYVGSLTQLGDEEIRLLQSVADAFSTAYARYEDFNKLEAAKKEVDTTLVNLKQAQQQLVQSEKMASLGELTAGIAHEIQNPLNFVNNFSDVSKELLDEMKAELATGNVQQAAEIADDVIENLEKILNHGKRADGIVKGMLQHSRSSSGQKELTDINALTDEYLRLAYHGLRAKDKSFNAKFESDFDPGIGKIEVVPQEIGRVILNLINNAFYAVTEKRKQDIEGYEPTVTVSTIKSNGKVEVRVKDNGIGISQKVLDKIFQPFFTTKPTGQGTGLGLSLAYDIVTKGHGGELKVETKEGEGTEFIVLLPV